MSRALSSWPGSRRACVAHSPWSPRHVTAWQNDGSWPTCLASQSVEFRVPSGRLSSELPVPERTQNSKLNTQNLQVAWLSLDASDNDPAVFLRYLIAALQGALTSAVGAMALLLIESPSAAAARGRAHRPDQRPGGCATAGGPGARRLPCDWHASDPPRRSASCSIICRQRCTW